MDRSNKTRPLAASLLAVLLLASASPLWSADTPGPRDNVIVNEAEELPKGLAIVPWKKSQPEALEEGPVRLVEEPLQPIDPDVFRRQLRLNPPATNQP